MARGAGLCVILPRGLLATGSQGLYHHHPSKGALYHHKEALSLLEKPGCCHGNRGGLERRGSTVCWGERAFQAEGSSAHRPIAIVGDGCTAQLRPSAVLGVPW